MDQGVGRVQFEITSTVLPELYDTEVRGGSLRECLFSENINDISISFTNSSLGGLFNFRPQEGGGGGLLELHFIFFALILERVA